MAEKFENNKVAGADLLTLQNYLELRHGPAIAQILIDDLETRESHAIPMAA